MNIGNTQPDGSGDHIVQVLTVQGKVITSPDAALSEAWIPTVFNEVGTNAIDTVVPDGVKYRLQSALVSYSSSSDAGDRYMEVTILDEDGETVIARSRVGIAQAASVSGRGFCFAQGFTPGNATFTGSNFLQCHLPQWDIPQGCTIRVGDAMNVDPADDSMTLSLVVLVQSMDF